MVSFVAAGSNSGKTTLIEKLIPLLKVRGLTVAVVKHASKGFDPEQPGKDSWRFREAGADTVAVVGPDGTVVMRRGEREMVVADLGHILGTCDVVLREGFKNAGGDRIEVFRAGVSGPRPLCLDDPSFIALVSDRKLDVALPQFNLNDAESIAAFIVEKTNLTLSNRSTETLKDSFNRQIDYLRISITDSCNLKCIYCMPEKGLKRFNQSDILTTDEIVRIVRIAAKNGVKKVRLTGGEPLLRKDIIPLISGIKSMGIRDLSITTNGQRLAEMAQELKRAGLDRVNISLDTLIADRYRKITRGGEIDRVWEGMLESERAGLSPVKINMVPVRGINDDEVSRFASLTMYRDIHVRFIEFMPIGNRETWKPDAYLSKDEIMARVASTGKLGLLAFKGGGPSRNYRIEGAPGMIGFISAISDCFCGSCNRLRLTAVGKLRPCLFSEMTVDIKTPLRNGAADEELEALYRHAVLSKPARHALQEPALFGPSLSPMSQIGG